MPDSRNLLGWLLVGLVSAVGAGAAILGATQSPTTASLSQAVRNTVRAPNYSEVFTESTSMGSETGYLTYQAPNRLGGYIETVSGRTYIYVQGGYEFQSVTVSKGASTAHLVFYRQRSQAPVSMLDPAQDYLNLVQHVPHAQRSGNTYTLSVTRGGQTGILQYTVAGQYIGRFTIRAAQTSVVVTISQVGTAPPIGLPHGSRVIGASPLPGGVAG
jgi:hypothetical protein